MCIERKDKGIQFMAAKRDISGNCVRLSTLTQLLPFSIGVIMDMMAFALSNADALLYQPMFFRKMLMPQSPFDAHSLGCLCLSLLIGHDTVLM